MASDWTFQWTTYDRAKSVQFEIELNETLSGHPVGP